ncbi:MAG: DNA repair protein RecO [Nocardioidaceae bacterium]|nr:DNA repair protein RecO [Nocardioidaceae bacterium]
MNLYRDEAIVLRTQKLGEADRIVTFLTRNTGRVRAVGKGVRRTKSKFGSRLEPFMHVDVQFARGRTLDIVTQVETLSPFAQAVAGDYARYTAGTAMLETAERLVAEEMEPSLQQYLLLVGAMRALASGEHEAPLVLDSFLLRSLAIAGYAPSFDSCARCAEPGPHRSFSAGSGGMLCSGCRIPGTANPAPETVSLLGSLLAGDWARAEQIDVRYRRPASGIVAAYLQWHLERGLRSLVHVERHQE